MRSGVTPSGAATPGAGGRLLEAVVLQLEQRRHQLAGLSAAAHCVTSRRLRA